MIVNSLIASSPLTQIAIPATDIKLFAPAPVGTRQEGIEPLCMCTLVSNKKAITSKIKHAIKLKTSPARLGQLLQPSLASCFSLQPMTAHRPVRRHWLQAKTKC